MNSKITIHLGLLYRGRVTQDSLFAAAVNVSSVHDPMVSAWGTSNSDIIERAIFPRYENSTTTIDDTTSLDKISMFIGGTGDDVVKPSTGNNLILGEFGNDTVDYSDLNHAIATEQDSNIVTVGKGTGNGKDILVAVEKLIATTYSDSIHQHTVTGMNIDGGAGNDTVDYSGIVTGALTGAAVEMSASADTVKMIGAGTGDPQDTLTSIETYIGTQGADTFTGTHGANTKVYLDGGAGSDSYFLDASASAATSVDALAKVVINDHGSSGVDTVYVTFSKAVTFLYPYRPYCPASRMMSAVSSASSAGTFLGWR